MPLKSSGKRARGRQEVERVIGGGIACLVGHCGLHGGALKGRPDYYRKHAGLGCRKRPGPKSAKARNARESFGDDWEKDEGHANPCTITIWPLVEIADQLRSYHDIQLTSPRDWWPIFFGHLAPRLGMPFWEILHMINMRTSRMTRP